MFSIVHSPIKPEIQKIIRASNRKYCNQKIKDFRDHQIKECLQCGCSCCSKKLIHFLGNQCSYS